MQGYLLDTNIISYWFVGDCPENQAVVAHVERLPPGSPLRISAISLGEIEFGFRVRQEDDSEFEADFLRFVADKLPLVLDVTTTTRIYYGSIKAELFEQCAPRNKKGKRPRVEQLADPVSGMELGIQENDLWIAAQAVEHNLVLVSNDKLVRIQSAAKDLRVENWAVPL